MSVYGDEVIRVKKTHEIVADRMRRQIVSGQLKVGDQLPSEEELTTTFGIARTTLREALRVLEAQGLIVIRRGRGGGPVVTQPDLGPMTQGLAMSLQLSGTTLGDLDEARQLMETHIAAQLAHHHTEADLAALREAVQRAVDAAEANDVARFGQASSGFHQTLVDRGGNITISTLSHLLRELIDTYYSHSASKADQRLMRRACRSYAKLVDLIEAGDADGAASHWRKLMAYTITAQGPEQRLDMYGN